MEEGGWKRVMWRREGGREWCEGERVEGSGVEEGEWERVMWRREGGRE